MRYAVVVFLLIAGVGGVAQVPGQAPVQGLVQVPTRAPGQGQTPAQVPTQTPTRTPVQMPVQVPTQMPVQMQVHTPAQMPVQTPVQVPVQTPAQARYPWQNRGLSVEERIDNLLSLLTIDEKITCLSTNPTIPRLGLRGTGQSEGLHGLALGVPGGWGRRTPVATTTFPQAIGMAETWDTALIRRAAAIEGYEARYTSQTLGKGGLVIRAPNADLGRDPRWGRTEECYGEDAFFNGTLVQAYVRGLQGDDPHYWQAASLMKHFLANSNENGRDSSSSDFDERLWREYYSLPFSMGVEAGSRAYMASYNKVNGIPQAVNPSLRKITVDEWGQNGIICTDGGAYRMLLTAHHAFKTPEEAAAACVKSGINQFLDNYRAGVKGALDQRLLTEKDVDTALRGVFRVMIKLGLWDDSTLVPYTAIRGGEPPFMNAEHQRLVRLLTQKSIVLLKNTDRFLPLDKHKIHSVAVLGSRSDQVYGDWYSGSPGDAVSPLQGIISKLGPEFMVNHTTNNDLAVSLAASSDIAIVCVGNHPTGGENKGWKQVSVASEGREAVDREQIDLDSAQENLVERVMAVNPHTVVVLISSFPYSINWINEHVPAILHLTHNSQELGNALADVLFGDVDPGGRLVQTWPRSLDQLPPMMDYDIRHGRTYMYLKGEPLYPFGYGLSYTSWRYDSLRISSPVIKDGVTVSINVTNTGDREGDEVVQLYVSHENSKVPRPIKELKGFCRLTLRANETKTVRFRLSAKDLAYWNVARQGECEV
jgi:beta-glucosidase